MTSRVLMAQRKSRILREECLAHDVQVCEVLGFSRKKEIVMARHSAMRRMRLELGLSLTAIGNYMGRDHSTVLQALQKFTPEIAYIKAPRGWHLGCQI